MKPCVCTKTSPNITPRWYMQLLKCCPNLPHTIPFARKKHCRNPTRPLHTEPPNLTLRNLRDRHSDGRSVPAQPMIFDTFVGLVGGAGRRQTGGRGQWHDTAWSLDWIWEKQPKHFLLRPRQTQTGGTGGSVSPTESRTRRNETRLQ